MGGGRVGHRPIVRPTPVSGDAGRVTSTPDDLPDDVLHGVPGDAPAGAPHRGSAVVDVDLGGDLRLPVHLSAPTGPEHRGAAPGPVTLEGPPSGGEDGREDEDPVLLLHGFPGSWRSFDAVVPPLVAAGRRCLVPEQRGYAPSARPAAVDAYRLDRLVADAVAVLDAAGAQRASVVGHDWGAVVAWALAASHPERVRDLVAVSVPHPRAFAAGLAQDRAQRLRSSYTALLRRRGLAERVLLAGRARGLRAAFAGSRVPPDVVAAHLAPLCAPAALAGALAWYRALRGRDLTAVGPVGVPTTYLWSDGDVAVARGTARRCAEHVVGPFRPVVLPGVSHWVPEERPDAVVDAVLHPPRP